MNTILATAVARAFRGGLAFRRGVRYSALGMDEHWITVHPNGKDHEGQPVLLSEAGEVLGGMGGKFNGRHISAVPQNGAQEHHGAHTGILREHAIRDGWKDSNPNLKAVAGGFVRVRSQTGKEYPDELVGKEKPDYKTVTADEVRKTLKDAGADLDITKLTHAERIAMFDPDRFRRQLREKYGYEMLGDHGLTPLEFERFLDQTQSQETIMIGVMKGMDDLIANSPDKFKELMELAQQDILSATAREEWDLKNQIEQATKAGKTEAEIEQIKKDAFVRLAKERLPYVLKASGKMIYESEWNAGLDHIKKFTDAEDLALESGIFATGSTVSLRSVHVPVCKGILRTYKEVCEKYPCLVGHMAGIEQGSHAEVGGLASMMYKDGWLNLSKEDFHASKGYLDGVAVRAKNEGFWATSAGGDGVRAIISHELGHAVEGRIWEGARKFFASLPSSLSKGKTIDNFAGDTGYPNLSRLMMDTLRGDKDELSFSREVSGYACKNPLEWFAESFAELTCEKNPRPQTKKFGELLNKILKGDISELKW